MSQAGALLPVVAIGLSGFAILISIVAIILAIVFRGTNKFDEITTNNINLSGEIKTVPPENGNNNQQAKTILSVPQDRITIDRLNVNSIFDDGTNSIRFHQQISGPSTANWRITRGGNAHFQSVHT